MPITEQNIETLLVSSYGYNWSWFVLVMAGGHMILWVSN